MSPTSSGLSGAYRAVWRWHFYAGLLVLPFLCLLALTGGLYLFKPELEQALYGRMTTVAARPGQVSPDRWRASAEAAGGGVATALTMPAEPDRAVRIKLSGPGGDRTVFVDPHDAQVTGSVSGEGVMDVVKEIHSLSLLGAPFNILVEIVAGWAIILVATGVYLWWPRRRDVGVMAPRSLDFVRRPAWRDFHALTGLYAGAIIAFLAVTGMPWSAMWGDRFLSLMRESGLGRPAAPAAASPFAHAEGHDKPAGTGWTMEGAVLPVEAHHHAPSARLSTVISVAEARRMPRPYTVSIPADPTLAFTVTRETQAAEQARSLYVDGRTGEVRADLAWRQFGAGAKAFEWGIAVHQGLQYGWPNRIVMLLGCVAVWVLAITAVTMWWKRRPRRGLGAPPAPPGARVRFAVLAIVLPLGVLYPLTGLSLLAALLLDHTTQRLRARLDPERPA